jgi:UDP-3-O-acyl N-acetylglucosamine deacetylase
MHTPRKQQTIVKPAAVEGFGYWSGRDIRVELLPAAANTGIVFVRTDVEPPVRIEAVVSNRIEVPRRTTLSRQGSRVEMVEHLMAALSGLQVDNCEIRVNGAEMPGMDGSAAAFVDALLGAGIVEQDAPRALLIVGDVTRVGNEEVWIEARPSLNKQLTVKYRLDYGNDNAIGRQTLQTSITPKTFRAELATSRTFMLQAEADWLRSQGLGTRVTTSDLLVFGDLGPIDNELRFDNECVRHKILDVVGDLALAGCDLVGEIVAHRSGHRLNAELVQALLAEGQLVHGWRRSA